MLDLAERIAERERILARIRTLLIGDLRVQRGEDEIDPDTPLFGTGLRLDSIDAVELVVAVESAFGLHLGQEPLGPGPFRTLNTLADFVLERQRS